jgi:arginyl-tRNA synthetase
MMFDDVQNQLETQILALCREEGIPLGQVNWNWIPFSGHWGLSLSFFQAAAEEAKQKGLKLNVGKRAQEIAQLMSEHVKLSDAFDQIEAVRGYLNIRFSNAVFSRRVIDTVLEEKDDFGRASRNHIRTMVEFSQPNTHKAFHVGHLRNVILGNAICNILDFGGDDVIRANYLGDIGLHVIKWLWCYRKYHAGEQPTGDITRWMGDIYAEATRRHEEEPDAEAEIRALFARWDNRDPEIVSEWEVTRQWSLDGFEQIYKTLNVKFDHLYFESDVEDSGKVIVDELIARGMATDERPEGAVVVKLDELCGTRDKYRVLVVLRSDGTSLYSTKDLALGIRKFEEFKLNRSIYVIDVRQSLYLQQIFKTLELLGYPWTDQLYHLAYEIVNLPGNVTMSSRDGTVVFLQDLIDEAITRARAVVEEKNPSLTDEEKSSIASMVAMGALKYAMLSRDNTKIVTFDWEAALDFNGQAAPYIQYAAVRANSILRKNDMVVPDSLPLTYELSEVEIELIDLISRVPKEVQRAAKEMKPLFIANLAFDLAQTFNNFYRQCPVLQAEPDVRDYRLRLAAAARQAISNCLALLGIETPEVM